MRCRNCGTENPGEARFCMRCATPLPLVCSKCGANLPPHARFCLICGAPMGAAVPDPYADAVRRLVPKEFADRLMATRGHVGMERRLAGYAVLGYRRLGAQG